MTDPRAPIAYLVFHGLIVHTPPLPGRHLFADADQISELRERRVLLSVTQDDLHEPREHPEHPVTDDKTGRRRVYRRGCGAPGTGCAPTADPSSGRVPR